MSFSPRRVRGIGAALALAVLAALPPASCKVFCGGFCSAQFVQVYSRVVDESGSPVLGAGVEVGNVRTGARRTITQYNPGDSTGTHSVFDDTFRRDVRRGGEWYRVNVARGSQQASVLMRFGTDECGCHVRRLEGVEVIVIH